MLAFLLALTLQAEPAADLSFLAGRWQGTLTYLDYKDNKTHVTLQATLTCARTDDGLRYRFEYVEPNGKTVAGDETAVTISPDRRSVRIGTEEWTVAASSSAGRVVLERDGTDAGRAVRFSRSYTAATADELRIQTTATPVGDGMPLVRNTYVLRRIQ